MCCWLYLRLLVRAMQIALNTDPGFDYAHTVTVDPALYAHAFEPAAAREYLDKLEDRDQPGSGSGISDPGLEPSDGQSCVNPAPERGR